MRIDVLPTLADNFIFVLSADGAAAVVDPGLARGVQHFLRFRRLRLESILLTHGHGDHIAGALPLQAALGGTVIGPSGSGIAGLQREVREGDWIDVPGGRLQVLATPGHLRHHVSYFDAITPALFCGDTLFGGGCGRLIDCPAEAFWNSLGKLAALPPETRVYCGHEYTVDNLIFAANLEPDNSAIAARLAAARDLAAGGRPTIPSTLAEELATNPFLRADSCSLRQAVGLQDAPAVEVFAEIRRRKDRW